MAELNTEDQPAVPPRQHTVVPMEDPGPRVREFLENSLEKVHDSLERKITEYHTAVERAICNSSPYIQADNSQASSSSGTLVTALWSLLEPKEERTLREFQEDPVGEVERRLSTLGEQLKTLSADKKKVEDDIGSYKARLATTRKEATEAKVAIQRLSEHNSKYREIILRGSSDDREIPDDKIHGQFVELRVLIQRIVHRHYAVQGHKKLTGHNNPWFEGQKKFRDVLKSLASEPLQRFGMRAKIFEFVDRDLISTRSFGVSKSEHSLKDFEEALDCSKAGMLQPNHLRKRELIGLRPAVSHSDLAEWRSRTIECGALLGEKSKWPGETCQDVLDFMDPYVSAATVGSAVSLDLLNKSMRELCDKAYSLSVLLRRSKKATFQTWAVKNDTIVTAPIEAKVSCQEFDGPAKAEILGSRVAMTIFGGLVKIPEDTSDGQIVLEKSHVVCRT
ncbi:MAG: hypothetical protein L6R38_002759 [Xanthoria sp. 2 TBL-2021]|nr:MAG: hypothetical protein L6R38_002759 [Xanthoria sp. 2 TBL-2021]